MFHLLLQFWVLLQFSVKVTALLLKTSDATIIQYVITFVDNTIQLDWPHLSETH